jgi:hypothetical protein
MKTVISSNKQLCHIWANQAQSHAKSNSVFFRGTSIFSYGEHYEAARIHTIKGKQFALINSYKYSVTTAKHLGYIRGSLHGLMPYFESPDVSDPKKAIEYADQCAANVLKSTLKVMKVTDNDSINFKMGHIHSAYKEASRVRKLLSRAEKRPSKSDLDAVENHLKARLKRYNELNTPEHRALLELERGKRAERLQAKTIAAQKLAIEQFRAGINSKRIESHFELLRIAKNPFGGCDRVQTSRGAEVDLPDALKLLKAIERGQNVQGAKIGSFTVTQIYAVDGDTCVQIGCHKILLSEAKQVLNGNEVLRVMEPNAG